MVIKSHEHSLSAWIFLIGIVLAIIAGIFTRGSTDPIVLVVIVAIGLIVGYFVPEKDVRTFLIASVSLVIVSYVGISGMVLNAAIRGVQIGPMVSSILGTLLMLFVPATIIVALKTVFSISRIRTQE